MLELTMVHVPYKPAKKDSDQLRKITGVGVYAVNEALRIERGDMDLAKERLMGKRPSELHMLISELDERIIWLEEFNRMLISELDERIGRLEDICRCQQ
jgi:hypothetical protein